MLHLLGRSPALIALAFTAIAHAQSYSLWQLRTSGTTANLHGAASMYRVDGVAAVAVGDSGTILLSNDSGATWTAVSSGTTETLNAVTFDDISQRFIAVGDVGTIVSSADGRTWSTENSPTTLALYSVDRGMAVGQAGVGLLVRDGNGVWSQQNVPFAGLTMYAIKNRAAVGEAGAYFVTSDGVNWQPQASGTTSDLYAVAGIFPFVVGANGTGVTGTNETLHGATEQFGGTQVVLTLTQRATFGADIVVGANGTILRQLTSYGAGTNAFASLTSGWIADPSPTRETLNAVVPLNYVAGLPGTLVVGNAGTILIHAAVAPRIRIPPSIGYDSAGVPFIEGSVGSDGPWAYGWFQSVFPIGTGYPRQALDHVPFGVRDVLTLVAINAYGITQADVVAHRLLNVSGRANIGGGENILIGGFATNGPQNVLIRGIGPSLAQFGISDAISAPRLTVYNGSTVVATNTGWQNSPDPTAISTAAVQAGAFPLASAADSAMIVQLNAAGVFTIHLDSADGSGGTGLIEIYGLNDPSVPSFVNLSARANVASGDSVLIGGFVVQGAIKRQYLLRAAGPALAAFGIQRPLAAPQLTLYKNGTPIATAAAWGAQPNAAAISSAATSANAFAFASGSADSAMLISLAEGSYTLVVTDANGGSGIALGEIYKVQ